MRWTPTLTTLLLATVLAGPALAQEGRDEAKAHGEMKGEHMEMRMHGAMAGGMTAHAEHLGLSDDQIDRLEALDERMEAEKERHHAEMKAIHEAGMEILTPEQRERMHQMMREMHAERGEGHEMERHEKHGEAKKDGDDADENDHDHPDA